MKKKEQEQPQEDIILEENKQPLGMLEKNRKSVKDLIAPAGIDASNANYLTIVSSKTRYARSMIVSTIPRMCTFPEFL